MSKPLIVWDFDDVLFPLTEEWFVYCGKTMQTQLRCYNDMTSNPPHKLMGITLSEYLESLDNFRNSERARTFTPHQAIAEWFAKQGDNFRHFVLTARPIHTIEAAKKWLNNTFGNQFEGLGFVPAKRPGYDVSSYYATKREYLEKENIKLSYFIDDKPSTVHEVSMIQGVKGIVYPRPWNSKWNERHNINELLSQIQ